MPYNCLTGQNSYFAQAFGNWSHFLRKMYSTAERYRRLFTRAELTILEIRFLSIWEMVRYRRKRCEELYVKPLSTVIMRFISHHLISKKRIGKMYTSLRDGIFIPYWKRRFYLSITEGKTAWWMVFCTECRNLLYRERCLKENIMRTA